MHHSYGQVQKLDGVRHLPKEEGYGFFCPRVHDGESHVGSMSLEFCRSGESTNQQLDVCELKLPLSVRNW